MINWLTGNEVINQLLTTWVSMVDIYLIARKVEINTGSIIDGR